MRIMSSSLPPPSLPPSLPPCHKLQCCTATFSQLSSPSHFSLPLFFFRSLYSTLTMGSSLLSQVVASGSIDSEVGEAGDDDWTLQQNWKAV